MGIHFYQDQWVDPKSLTIVNSVGEMRRLYTPFKVVCIVPVKDISPGAMVYVEEVVGSISGELYYVVSQHPYLYKHFDLLIKF